MGYVDATYAHVVTFALCLLPGRAVLPLGWLVYDAPLLAHVATVRVSCCFWFVFLVAKIMQPRPEMHIGKTYIDANGLKYMAVQAQTDIYAACYVLIDNLARAIWTPPLPRSYTLSDHQTYAFNDTGSTIHARNFFWALIIDAPELRPPVDPVWQKPKGNYIIGADPGANYMQSKFMYWNPANDTLRKPVDNTPDYFPRASLLTREGPKCWIISEFRGGWPVIPEHPVKWNQVLFDSAEVRCIPPEEWDALGLKPSAVSLFGSPVDLYETHAMNDGPVNYWFVESLE